MDGSDPTPAEASADSRGVFRRLMGDSVLYGVGRIAGYLVALVLMPLYTRHLPPESYGVLENLFVFLGLAASLLSLGLPDAVLRYWFVAGGDERERRRTAGTAFAITLAVLATAVPALWFAGPLLCGGWIGEGALPAYRLAVAAIPVSAAIGLSFALLRSRFRSDRYGICSVAQVVLLMLVNIWLVAGLGMGVRGVFLGGLVAGAATAALALYFVRADLGLAFSRARAKELLAYSLPLLPGAVAFWALGYADRYLVTDQMGLAEAGRYAAGAKIAGVLAFVNFAATTAFGPLAISISARPDAPRLYGRALTGFIAAGAVAAVGLSALAREAISILSPPEYLDGYRVVPWLAVGLLLAGAATFVNIGLHIVKKTHHVMWVAVVAAAANVALNLLWIPVWGMIGAAAATAASYGLMVLLYDVVTRRHFPVVYDAGRLLRLAALAAAAFAGILLLDGPGVARILGRVAVAGAFSILLPVAGIVTFGEMKKLLLPSARES